MSAQINDLIAMGDTETLYDLMVQDEDWMNQLDAAEGLVKLGDRRGLDFLLSAQDSEEKDIRQAAREILGSAQIAARRQEIEADEQREFKRQVEAARLRLQKGQPVFRYKMVFLPSGELLSEDPVSEGFDVPALDEFGLQGWEVVSILPRQKPLLIGGREDQFTGAYFLLKKAIGPGEAAELDEL